MRYHLCNAAFAGLCWTIFIIFFNDLHGLMVLGSIMMMMSNAGRTVIIILLNFIMDTTVLHGTVRKPLKVGPLEGLPEFHPTCLPQVDIKS